MARNTQEFETVIRLNAQQAKDELKTMQERLDELKRKKDTLLSGKDYDAKDLRALNKEIRQQSAAVKAFGSSVQDTIHTLSNLDKASLGELQKSVRNLRRQMANVTNEEEFRQLDALMQKANARILELKGSAGEAATETRRVAEAAKTVNAVLANVNGASLSELRTAAAAIREEMEKTKPDTNAYPFLPSDKYDQGREYARCPITYTDWRMYKRYPSIPSNNDNDCGSLSLQPSFELYFPFFKMLLRRKPLATSAPTCMWTLTTPLSSSSSPMMFPTREKSTSSTTRGSSARK